MPYNTKVFNTSLQMSTRGRIGIELSDGSILSAYHHWDSYPSWLGRILNTHYNTREKVAELIDGGDMSSCWTDTPFNHDGTPSEYGPNYYSYRGDDCPPRHDENKYDYIVNGEEYAYLYTLNDEWVCYALNENDYPTVVEIPSAPLFV